MSRAWQQLKQEVTYWTQRDWSPGDTGAFFDQIAYEYDEINEGAHSYFRRFTDTLRIGNLPDNAHLLDVQARTGNGTATLWQHGKVRTAVCADVSYEFGQICQQRLHDLGFHDFRWVLLTDYQWPFADEAFDVVLSLESVEHFARPGAFIGELGRVTRPGGTLILSTPNVLWEPIHALAAITGLHHSEGPHRFVPYNMLRQAISRAGFQVEHAETTVLIPAGPQWLLDWGERLEDRTRHTLMPWLGLRRFFICRKLP
ncbi:MAG: methyltransferase domain-containing protein [Ardenticatenaceae bacterium]|nr:methyltransferase domain-containing protein [Anaerolineales bacterium]MCB8917644.1 methyltransferase domain-containing protein [Ardenticatenaceae bacterium]